MKRRIMTFLLAVCMAVSLLAVPAGAANTAAVTFSDVGDKSTAVAVESLRLLGVLDGYGDGAFRPGTVLTRAQFCKMAVYAMNGSNELGRYRTVTVFSDVKPSYWAAPYINMAAKGKNIISGYADGKFHPDRTVTVGQAVTILLRMLGYKDEDVGGVWPDSYVADRRRQRNWKRGPDPRTGGQALFESASGGPERGRQLSRHTGRDPDGADAGLLHG